MRYSSGVRKIMEKPYIKLYIDAVSPFGYLGYWFVRNSPLFRSVDVEYVPIRMFGLLELCGNTPPLTIKNKEKWTRRERLAWARLFNIPMREKFVPSFPIPTDNTQQLLSILYLKDPKLVPIAFDAIVQSIWAPETMPKTAPKPTFGPEFNVDTPQDLRLLLSPEDVLGEQLTEELITAMGSAEAKEALTSNTRMAFDESSFGLPWFQCTNTRGQTEGFWGFDHLGRVVDFLGLESMHSQGGSRIMQPLL